METDLVRDKGRRCLICNQYIEEDPRQKGRQVLCGEKACRREYKKRWRQHKYATDQVFHEAEDKRGRVWRRNHPGYWKGKPPDGGEPLPSEPELARLGSQLKRLDLVVSGLISHTAGILNRDHLKACLTQCIERGRAVQLTGSSP